MRLYTLLEPLKPSVNCWILFDPKVDVSHMCPNDLSFHVVVPNLLHCLEMGNWKFEIVHPTFIKHMDFQILIIWLKDIEPNVYTFYYLWFDNWSILCSSMDKGVRFEPASAQRMEIH